MSAPAPIPMRWQGDVFAPLPRFAKLCNASFVVGQVYHLQVVEERSAISHRHFFAQLNEAWQNLPDRIATRYPSVEHLRKYALIQAGFCDQRQLVAASKAEALRIAAYVRPADTYAVVTVRDAVVTTYTAVSQSNKAMGRVEFQRSKQACLDFAASLLEVAPAALAEARAA